MRVNYTIIFVSDMAPSISFYRDVLGIPLKFESPGWTEFVTEGVTLTLHKSDGSNPDSTVLLLGEFVDDYGIHYSISDEEWHQHPESRYRVVRWQADAQNMIAQNGTGNPSDPNLWTRIDWIELSEMAPYEWAFCMSAYAAATAAEAEATTIAQRENPKTGCNGHPFSRMRHEHTRNP